MFAAHNSTKVKKRRDTVSRFFLIGGNTHGAGIAFLLTLFLLLASGCSSVRKNYAKVASEALPPPPHTINTRHIAEQLAMQPEGHSGFRLLALGTEALTARIALADQAASSLDVQYYMIHDDSTGRLVIKHILAAADRGVRVRVLIDDIHVIGNDRNILAIDTHPNVEVRIFNPFKIRKSLALGLATQFLFDGRRLNRRMHNKSFIADNQVAIIGGRNIGDEYFDARQDMNFRDLDVLAVGPIVAQISQSFDDFWNSDAAYPLVAFYDQDKASKKLIALRATLEKNARDYPSTENIRVLFSPTFAIDDDPDDLFEDDLTESHAETPHPRRFNWCWAPAQLIADDPGKANPYDAPKKGPHIGEKLAEIITTANEELLLISPTLSPVPKGWKCSAISSNAAST
ncbi:phospholipase D-like domain-containing protein [Ereboglobus luteus]|uniref:PLD phosphodiesterase domain-containing protein n=1 Tax=Ereboglobus luteus TaxID=1796921 RepID=A0A2U8E6C7_9BACT|nr:phospholipase D-like domain-containing protein [Ereboglobus luteus]AWI10386.1 hypothetical protein CKA38_14975 [Ereboglobus luteus]